MRERSKSFGAIVVASAAAATTAIYVVFRSTYYFPDAMRWELGIAARGAPVCWHPHHIIYNPLAMAFHAVLKLFGYGGRLFGAMQIMDALVGGAGFLLTYAILRRAAASRPLALAAACASAFSFGYWSYACNAESVILNTVAAMAAFLAAQWAAEREGFRRWGLAALVAGAGVLTHITNVFVLVFLVVAYLLAKPRGYGARLPWLVLLYFTPAAFVYGVVGFGVLHYAGIGDVARWIFGAPGQSQYYMTYRLYNVALDFYALARNFFGLRWAKDVMIGGWTAGCAALAAVVAAGVAALATAFVGAAVRLWRKGAGRRAAWLAAALFFPHAVFFTFRDAGGIDRWTIQAFGVLFFIYAGAAAAAPRRFGRAVLYALPALLFVANFWGSIYPESKPENNEHLAFVRFVDGLTNPGDVVVTSGFGGIGAGIYLTYFAGVEEANIYCGARDADAFERSLEGAVEAGRDVYVADVRPAVASTDFIAPGAQAEYSVTGAAAAELLAGYERELVGTYRGPRYAPSRVWRLVPPG